MKDVFYSLDVASLRSSAGAEGPSFFDFSYPRPGINSEEFLLPEIDQKRPKTIEQETSHAW